MSKRWFFLSKEEVEARVRTREELAEWKREDAELRRESDYYAIKIPEVLAGVGIDHWLPIRNRPPLAVELVTGRSGRQMVQFLEVKYEPNAIYLRIDSQKLPYNTVLEDLYKPEVLETLSHACGHQVIYVSEGPEYGAWFVVLRNGAIARIPEMFPFKDAVELIPQNAPPLSYVIGVGTNRKVTLGNLASMPHLLIAGSTGTGKSVHINSILIQLLRRNTPETARFMMIDLKGGTELQAYEAIPHLMCPIVKRPEDVAPALIAFEQEIGRRQAMCAERGVKNIEGWNHVFPGEKMPYLILVIDELAEILRHPVKKFRDEATVHLDSIMRTSRSQGGDVILCTQRPSADVIEPFIKTNATTRIAFSVPQQTDSRVIIDCGLAARLKPAGRAIYQNGPDLIQLQTPLIEDGTIERELKLIRSPLPVNIPTPDQKIGLNQVLEESLDNFKGSLNVRALFNAFRGEIALHDLVAMLKSLDGRPIEVRGKSYRVVRRGLGRGRYLQLVRETKPIQMPAQEPEETLISSQN